MVRIARRMDDIPFSTIRQFFEQVNILRAQGRHPVPFHVGAPDFDTPAHIKQAAKDALDAGQVAYTSNYGLPKLRQAIARKLFSENGVKAEPDTEVLVTVGTNEAISLIMMGLLDPGDEVLIPDPMWVHYIYCARLAGASAISIPLEESTGFQLDAEAIASRITPRTRMIILNNPHNPTGVVYTSQTLQAIAALARRHDLLIVSDEIYERIIYDDAQHISPATLPGMAERTITVNGFSKAYAMTGWRVGYVAAPAEIIQALVRVHQYTTICPTTFAQIGAITALENDQECVRLMVSEFDRRRRVLLAHLANIPHISVVQPRGAFYAFVNIRRTGLTASDFAQALLDEEQVAVVPGTAFGNHGEGYVRIAYACSLEDAERGMMAFKRFVNRHTT